MCTSCRHGRHLGQWNCKFACPKLWGAVRHVVHRNVRHLFGTHFAVMVDIWDGGIVNSHAQNCGMLYVVASAVGQSKLEVLAGILLLVVRDTRSVLSAAVSMGILDTVTGWFAACAASKIHYHGLL